MRIILLIDNLGPGGAQRQLVGLAVMLKHRGYDVKVCVYRDNPFYKSYLSENQVECEHISLTESVFKRIYSIYKYLKKEKPDWVIAYLESPCIYACLAKILGCGFKLIVSERNTTQHTGINERIRFNLFRIADYVVPNAYSQENYIKKTFLFLSNKVVTIPNFVDLEHFVPPLERNRREVSEVMIAASIWPSKNTLGFINAVAALKAKGYQFHISWYGLNTKHIDYINQCRQKIKRFGVADCIELKEKTTQIKERYQDADYFCLPSFYEGTPNVICEAMACGLPVVCSDVCDNSKYVIENENGFLFNPKDTDSIVAAFERLFTLTEEEYKSYCHNSRTLAEQKLSKEAFVNAYLKLIKE